MSTNAELAAAARWVGAVAKRLPTKDRPDVARLWGELLDSIEGAHPSSAEIAIIEWRQDLAEQLGVSPDSALSVRRT